MNSKKNEGCLAATLLAKNAVLRIDRNSRVREIRIVSGKVWLTTTPADGDVILGAGEKWKPGTNSPVVIEALEPAELLLLSESDDPRRMLFMPLCMWVSVHDPDTAH